MGDWVQRGAIKVWAPTARRARPKRPTLTPLTEADVAQMVACPVCLALVCQPCRTITGNSTTHVERLVPRRCACGALVAPRKTYCEDCRASARRRTYWRREVTTPTAQRRRTPLGGVA